MSRMLTLNSPFLLGFDAVERARPDVESDVRRLSALQHRAHRAVRNGAGNDLITLAVAGFKQEELEVTLEENQLLIRGRQSASTRAGSTSIGGSPPRQFQRVFLLAEGTRSPGPSWPTAARHRSRPA